jgi:RNA polymerase sigma-70 factor (ECF subfamily)
VRRAEPCRPILLEEPTLPPSAAPRRRAPPARRPPERPGEADDKALLAAIGRKDVAALEAFYRRHFVRVLRFAGRVTRDPTLAEEVVNEVMMVVWEKAATFRGLAQPTTWLLGITYRVALKRAGAGRHERQHQDLAEVEIEAPGDLEAATARDEIGRVLRRALGSLTPAHRAVVELTYFQGYSCEEVARLLGCPVGTVKTRMLHARHRLRRLLAARAVTGADAP